MDPSPTCIIYNTFPCGWFLWKVNDRDETMCVLSPKPNGDSEWKLGGCHWDPWQVKVAISCP